MESRRRSGIPSHKRSATRRLLRSASAPADWSRKCFLALPPRSGVGAATNDPTRPWLSKRSSAVYTPAMETDRGLSHSIWALIATPYPRPCSRTNANRTRSSNSLGNRWSLKSPPLPGFQAEKLASGGKCAFADSEAHGNQSPPWRSRMSPLPVSIFILADPPSPTVPRTSRRFRRDRLLRITASGN